MQIKMKIQQFQTTEQLKIAKNFGIFGQGRSKRTDIEKNCLDNYSDNVSTQLLQVIKHLLTCMITSKD